MKKIYVLIVAEGCISLDTHFYKIYVGVSARDQMELKTLYLLSECRNWFFQKQDSETANFLNNIAKSLSVSIIDLPTTHISITDFMRHLRKQNSVPPIPAESREAARMRELLRPSTYWQRKHSVRHHAEALIRNKPKSLPIANKL